MNKYFLLFSIVLLVGCASHPDKMEAAYISPMKYRNYDCDQIALEAANIERRTIELYETLKSEADKDTAQMAGSLLFWPLLLTIEGGDGPRAGEYKNVKGEYAALEEVSIRKKCELVFDLPEPSQPETETSNEYEIDNNL